LNHGLPKPHIFMMVWVCPPVFVLNVAIFGRIVIRPGPALDDRSGGNADRYFRKDGGFKDALGADQGYFTPLEFEPFFQQRARNVVPIDGLQLFEKVKGFKADLVVERGHGSILRQLGARG